MADGYARVTGERRRLQRAPGTGPHQHDDRARPRPPRAARRCSCSPARRRPRRSPRTSASTSTTWSSRSARSRTGCTRRRTAADDAQRAYQRARDRAPAGGADARRSTSSRSPPTDDRAHPAAAPAAPAPAAGAAAIAAVADLLAGAAAPRDHRRPRRRARRCRRRARAARRADRRGARDVGARQRAVRRAPLRARHLRRLRGAVRGRAARRRPTWCSCSAPRSTTGRPSTAR